AMTRVVSMNSPVKYRGYSFYQSSYRQEPGRVVSYLSIARDPGLPIVFTGYIGALMGMTIVLGTRMAERRRAVQAEPVAIGLGQADNPRASGSAATRQPETESRALAGAGHKSRTLTRFSRSSR
ncbi:MAG: hypothetical protein ACE5HE_12125, partial [Phycisphaerae bacterium]